MPTTDLVKLSPEQLAMAFDCEGGFTYATPNGGLNCRVYITQNYCDRLLYSIQSSLGFGSVYAGHDWSCFRRDDIRTFLAIVEPYLIVIKNDQVKLFRHMLDTITGGGYPLTPQAKLLRAKLLEIWDANYSRAAKHIQRVSQREATKSGASSLRVCDEVDQKLSRGNE